MQAMNNYVICTVEERKKNDLSFAKSMNKERIYTVFSALKGTTGLEKGQRVIFDEMMGREIEIEGKTYVYVDLEAIVCII